MASKIGALFSAADAANYSVTLGDRRPSTVLMMETWRSLAYFPSIAGAISMIFLFGVTVQLTGIEADWPEVCSSPF